MYNCEWLLFLQASIELMEEDYAFTKSDTNSWEKQLLIIPILQKGEEKEKSSKF